MAEGGNVPELGGYHFEFISTVPEDRKCLVCLFTMKDPVQIEGCGHRLCSICMESWLRRPSPTCPVDRSPLSREKEHYGVCGKFPVQCTNKCGLRDIPREKLDVNVRDECPATEVQCEYKNLGCEEVDQSQQIERLLGKETEQSEQIERLMSKEKETQGERRLNLAEEGLQATQLQVNDLVSLVKDQSEKIQRLMSRDEEQLQEIEKLQHSPSYSPFVWKIAINPFQSFSKRELERKRRIAGDDVHSLSEEFSFSRHSYKYLLKMKMAEYKFCYLNQGQECFRPVVFSLYIKVVPGEFDSLLTWPCKEKVRVTLIDQDPCEDKKENISHVVDFEIEEVESSQAAKKCNYDCFIANFSSDTLKSRSYIKNNIAFIMVSKE
ncbi:hypothetical protein ACROYT_G042217 [Oculina patagonica]